MRIRPEFIAGALVGAGIMYLLDPDRGPRRRSLIADKATHARLSAGERLESRARDLRNRSKGVLAEARHRLRPDEASDEVLEARVRSELGHAVDHAGGLTVVAQDGRVMVGGPIPAGDVERVLATVRKVRGVREVESRLEPRGSSDGG